MEVTDVCNWRVGARRRILCRGASVLQTGAALDSARADFVGTICNRVMCSVSSSSEIVAAFMVPFGARRIIGFSKRALHGLPPRIVAA